MPGDFLFCCVGGGEAQVLRHRPAAAVNIKINIFGTKNTEDAHRDKKLLESRNIKTILKDCVFADEKRANILLRVIGIAEQGSVVKSWHSISRGSAPCYSFRCVPFPAHSY